jgi:septal ring factor EnvC (AmiA/AmiB activator)
MSFIGTRTVTSTSSASDRSKQRDTIFAISTDDYQALTTLVNEYNVNQVIDTKNGYTALHYAIRANNDKMIEFLLKLGANPLAKTNTNQDAFDLSLKYQTKTVISHAINGKSTEIDNQKKTISALERKINDLEINSNYLERSVKDLGTKQTQLKSEIKDLQTRNNTLESKNSQLTAENTTLRKDLENVTNDREKLKRKYDSLDASYTGLLSKMTKK